jgi:hypothetical protein
MEAYIKYKRIHKSILDEGENVQKFFDDLSANGWDIIYYNEIPRSEVIRGITFVTTIEITIVVGKRQSKTL